MNYSIDQPTGVVLSDSVVAGAVAWLEVPGRWRHVHPVGTAGRAVVVEGGSLAEGLGPHRLGESVGVDEAGAVRVEEASPATAVDDPGGPFGHLLGYGHQGARRVEVHGLVQATDGDDEHVGRLGHAPDGGEISDVPLDRLDSLAEQGNGLAVDDADHVVATVGRLGADASAEPAAGAEDYDERHSCLYPAP